MREVRPLRRIEKWSNIIQKLSLDISKPLNYVTAKQVKQSSNEEPRLMAKMDTEEDLPSIFRNNGLFLLPIDRQGYVIIRGNGYHKLERILEPPLIHKTSYLFPMSCSDVTSERVYLDYAFSSGLLTKCVGVTDLNVSFGDKRTTPSFIFNVNGSTISVNRAQIEIDAVYENRDEIVIVEAKIGVPNSFNIKQLYYPFRTFYGRKKIRNFFFCFDPNHKTYSFWEYRFRSFTDFDSIELISCKQYQIEVLEIISTKPYRIVKPIIKADIPQANDVNKIIQFPYRVFDGYDTSQKMTDAFCFVERQSSYYRQAAEILGLVTHDRNNKYKLTPTGEVLLSLPSEKKSEFICKRLLEFPIMNKIFLQISIDRDKIITKQEIIDMLRNQSHLTGDTLGRRAQTIIAWFRWMRNNLGIVEIERNGNIRLARQMKLL